MPFIAYPDEYYENLCEERYKPVEYEIAKDNNNPTTWWAYDFFYVDKVWLK